ncbi:LOW QUALITY PROTEIN: hypothetical protein M514_22061 [Trichuris suis]|uniref:Reverse transcriptase domain-containing protein n=1 Tax=Trichuris suis TaxID=68888 RepID=A0A085N8C6_9BILA|nr:LOW QUALITY PROTEIN: hypothetical protein M514_22061 [Trichuris suis]
MVDMRRRRLTDGSTNRQVGVPCHPLTHCKFRLFLNLHHLNTKTSSIDTKREVRPISHSATHHIRTFGSPVHCHPGRLASERLRLAKQELASLLSAGIVRPSDSQWSSRLHIEQKPSGSGEYVATIVNAVTIPDCYPIPHIQDFTSTISGAQIFSKIDLVRAFHQISMDPASIAKTAVSTPFGLFKFLRMPFGLRNAAQSFQRPIDQVLRGLPFCYAYIDDLIIVVMSKSIIGIYKFFSSAYKSLRSSSKRTNASLAHLSLILLDTTSANTVSSLSHKKLRPCWPSHVLLPLVTSKDALAHHATLLAHPKPDAPTNVTVDASEVATGAVLQQFIDGSWCPISFFSKQLNKSQQQYSTFSRELLAIYQATKHFRYFLEGRQFFVLTDHKPLIYNFSLDSNRHKALYLQFISEFTTDMRYVKAGENVVANALSRWQQHKKTELQRLRSTATSLQLTSFQLPSTETALICDTSTGRSQPFLLHSFRRKVFDSLHS